MKVTDHNFKIWWNSLREEEKDTIIAFILLNNPPTKSNPFSTPSEEEFQEQKNKPLDKDLIEKIKSINNVNFSTINNYRQTFNFRSIKYLQSVKHLKIFDSNHYSHLPEIKYLEKIEFLFLINCRNLNELTKLPIIKNPLYLSINYCRNLNYNSFSSLTNINEIHILNSCNFTFLNQQPNSNLKHLEINKCNNSDIEIDFKLYPYLKSLKIINTTGNIKLKNPHYSKHLDNIKIKNSSITNPEELEYIPIIRFCFPKNKTTNPPSKFTTHKTKKGTLISLT